MTDIEIAKVQLINTEYVLWKCDNGTWAIQGINGISGRVVRDSEYDDETKARKMWAKLVERVKEANDLHFTRTYRKAKTYRQGA